MSHLYTILIGGTVIAGGGRPECSAIAWAQETVLALGSAKELRAISRGDSTTVDLDGGFVLPQEGEQLEVGGPADLEVFRSDPRVGARPEPIALVRGGRVVNGALPGPYPRGGRFGKSTAAVEGLLDSLRVLPPADWKALQDAHAEIDPTTTDEAEEALSGVLDAQDLREVWFELRHEATALAKKAAADYATQTHEGIRTLEHVAAVNAWDGQHEASKLEVLGPAHERGFSEAAAGALGVAMARAYIAEKDFERFWAPYQPNKRGGEPARRASARSEVAVPD